MLKAGSGGSPVAVHFDEELEEDGLLKEIFDVLASLGTDTLEGGAGFADEDAFLGFALAVDDSGNLNQLTI